MRALTIAQVRGEGWAKHLQGKWYCFDNVSDCYLHKDGSWGGSAAKPDAGHYGGYFDSREDIDVCLSLLPTGEKIEEMR